MRTIEYFGLFFYYAWLISSYLIILVLINLILTTMFLLWGFAPIFLILLIITVIANFILLVTNLIMTRIIFRYYRKDSYKFIDYMLDILMYHIRLELAQG